MPKSTVTTLVLILAITSTALAAWGMYVCTGSGSLITAQGQTSTVQTTHSPSSDGGSTLQPGQTRRINATSYEWSAAGCRWAPPVVCFLPPCAPQRFCDQPSPAGLNVKLCFVFSTGTEICADVSGAKSGWRSDFNGWTVTTAAPPAFRFKYTVNGVSNFAGVSVGGMHAAAHFE